MDDSANKLKREAEFLRLLAANEPQIAACVHSLIPLWNDAEDVLQETRTRLWAQFERYEAGTDFAAWARTIARFLVKAYYTEKGRERVTFSPAVVELISAEVERSGDSEEFSDALVGCVRKLSRKHQLLLHKHYTQGQQLPEIAEETGRSLSGLYSTFSRLRGQLMECIRRRVAGRGQHE